MAIFHFSSKVISRSQGQSAVASAAYRAGAIMYDKKYLKLHCYDGKDEVAYSRILIPASSPAWLQELETLSKNKKHSLAAESLWNLVEATEKRKDSQLAREIEVALPIELTLEQNVELVEKFACQAFTSKGMVADANIHWKNGNPHIHFMLTTRKVNEFGFSEKARDWNSKALFQSWRALWAETCNRELARHGFSQRIDHRSYDEQGILLEPTKHEGIEHHKSHGADKPDAKHEPGSIKERNKAIKERNRAIVEQYPEIIINKVAQKSSDFSDVDLANELVAQMPKTAKLSPGFLSALLDSIASLRHNWHEKNIDLKLVQEVISAVSSQQSAFSDKDIAKAVNLKTEDVSDFTRLLLKVKSSPFLLPIGLGEDGREHFTTKAAFEMENQLQASVDKLRARHKHVISGKTINQLLSQHTLNPSQENAVRHILRGPDISAIVGFAGSGKSYAMRVARLAWEKKGFKVHGVALAGVAAGGLQNSSNIESRTLASFHHALSTGAIRLGKKDVVVMDESGMVDNHNMQLVHQIRKSGSKLVLIGDSEQLVPIGPGAPFRAITERIGFAEINEIYRQKEAWQKTATIQLARMKTYQALTSYERRGFIHLSDSPSSSEEKLIASWQSRYQSGEKLEELLILAYRNKDVHRLNALAREKILSHTPQKYRTKLQTVNGIRDFAVGERLLFLKNSHHLDVKNGQRGTLVDFNESQLLVRLDGEISKEVVIPYHDYIHFDYGYASTVHKAQGMTVDRTFVYAVGAWFKNLTYVAFTRHRLSVDCFGDKETHKDVETLKHGLSRYASKDSVMDFPLAFAQRRGMNVDSLSERFRTHMLNKMNAMKGKIQEAYEEAFRPGDFWEKQKQKIIDKKKEKETLERRKDANLVTEYVDARIATGKAWQRAFKVDGDFSQLNFKQLKSSFEFKDYQEKRAYQCSLAFQICKNVLLYERALLVNNIDKSKLIKDSEKYEAKLLNTSHSNHAHDANKEKEPHNEKTHHWDAQIIMDKLCLDAESFAKSLLGQPTKRSTKQELFFGSKKGSLQVPLSGKYLGTWRDWSSDEGGSLIDLASYQLGLDFKGSLEWCAQYLGLSKEQGQFKSQITPVKKVSEPQLEFTAEQTQNMARASWIFEHSLPVKGTTAERYLSETRALNLKHYDSDYIRYQPPLFDNVTNKHYPQGIVFAGRNKENKVQTIQTVYLDDDAKKAALKVPKRTIGPYREAFVLAQKGKGKEVAIAEGPETALSVAQSDENLTVYIAFGVSNFSKIRLEKDVSRVYLCADNDGENGASNKQVEKAVQAFVDKGVNIYLAKPKIVGWDFNDVLKNEGIESVRNSLRDAKPMNPNRDFPVIKDSSQQLVSLDNLMSEFKSLTKEEVTLFATEPGNIKKHEEIDLDINELAKAISFHPEFTQDNKLIQQEKDRIISRANLYDGAANERQTDHANELEREHLKIKDEIKNLTLSEKEKAMIDHIAILGIKNLVEFYQSLKNTGKTEASVDLQLKYSAKLIRETPNNHEATQDKNLDSVEILSKALDFEVDMDKVHDLTLDLYESAYKLQKSVKEDKYNINDKIDISALSEMAEKHSQRLEKDFAIEPKGTEHER